MAIYPGYRYMIANREYPHRSQTLQFAHDGLMHSPSCTVSMVKYGATCECGMSIGTIVDGTTSEEIVSVLIHRLQYLNKEDPAWQKKCAIEYLQAVRCVLNNLAKEYRTRGAEGTPSDE